MSTKTEVGRVVWHDLMTNDVATAKRFYAELLGWTYQIEHASDFVWKPGDVDATVDKVATLGASVRIKGTHAPNAGRYAVLTDPTGAVFGLLTSNECLEP